MNTTNSPQVIAIRARYQSSLPEKSEMLAAHERVLETSQDEQTLKELKDDLHKLAGSSGMYGYHDISGLCRKAMYVIEQGELADLGKYLGEVQNLLKQYA